jgi:hypothetical protein
MKSLTEFETIVVQWVSEWSRRPIDSLSPQTCINCGFVKGLGVDGEDADDLIRFLHDKSGVGFSDFQFDQYFGPELSIAAWPFRPLWMFQAATTRRRLTIRDLASFMFQKIERQSGGG